MPALEPQTPRGKNVLGQPLDTCGCDPMTGFYRDGCCNTGPEDLGVHTICCVVDAPFLAASKALGIDVPPNVPEHATAMCPPPWETARPAHPRRPTRVGPVPNWD